ncbi:MAG TPA: SPOR domain-containing protein [Thermoanaerobaculia bacterium]|jgi:cell division septation protein DedD|nr:SPOR domain-containing protein [Thermoanaerobaculia bacterium]
MTTEIERGGMDVSGSHEPSYYEIALTNRQVVVAFVILLTCVVAAFFSGVWIGRESTARAQERLALLARSHGGDPADGANGAAGADKEKPEGQALQEFKFFADPRHRPAAAAKGAHDAGGAGSASGAGRASGADAARDASGAGDAGGARGKPAGTAAASEPAPASMAGAAGKGAPAQPAPPTPATRSTLAEDLGRRTGSPAGSAAASVPAAPKAAASAVRNERGGSRKNERSPAADATDAAPAGEGEPLPAASAAPASAARNSRAARPSGADTTDRARGSASAGAGSEPASATGGKKPAITWSPAAASPAASPAAAPAGSTEIGTPGEVVIQVFSTADKEQADKVRDGLVDAGFTAFLAPIAKGGQTMYRVRIGPFPSRSAAEAVAEKVRKERKLDTWITPK